MKLSKLTAAALAATLGLASVGAHAQHGHRDGRDRDDHPGYSQRHEAWRGHAPERRYERHDHGDRHDRYDRRDYRDYRAYGPQPQFYRGQRLPAEWRGHQHRVNDWRAYHLSAPPQGQQWVQVGSSDFALVALATGVITSLILANN
ncbi:RcnB family protein [Xenophilus arseniciresistens]|uniref:RcnB family protein n=1 Tax=Xenophilus arseniciresistens TaxID=1283306 RepID=A0AAE3SYB8_9BURK|nr:RcnB family protein [Xenophilus arseniciresistens]MDA7415325.1 RcnB family protein [Xenophilus arseniciresistens]